MAPRPGARGAGPATSATAAAFLPFGGGRTHSAGSNLGGSEDARSWAHRARGRTGRRCQQDPPLGGSRSLRPSPSGEEGMRRGWGSLGF